MAVSPLGAGSKLIGRFLGNTIAEGAAFAAGVAIGPVLGPPVQALRNTVNAKYPFVYPDALTLAEGVAQGQVDPDTAKAWALYHGIGPEAFAALVNIANTGPPLGQAMELLRRGVWTPGQYSTALNRQGIEKQWYEGLLELQTAILSPDDLARGIHKSLIPDPGLLAVGQPVGVGKVPAYPVYDIDAIEMAAGSGYTKDELGVLVGLQGNPMGPHEAAQAVFRGTIEKIDFDRAIAEGNTRNEWGDAIMEQSRQIPTTHDFLENYLRGYTKDFDVALAGAAKHGMTPEDATLVFENLGRPLTLHQITTGLARGGTFQPEPNEQTDPYQAAVRESSVKPSYYDLAIANRYSLPGYFVIKAMLANGTLTADEAATIFKQEGWPPDLADKAAAALAPTSGGASSIVGSHTTSAIGAVRKAYIVAQMSEADARTDLTELAVAPADQDALVKVWNVQRRATLPTLTVTQIQKGNLTYTEAHDALQRQGYSETEITELLGPAPVTGNGSPVGVLTPTRIGEQYTDTLTGNRWASTGLTNTSWTQL